MTSSKVNHKKTKTVSESLMNRITKDLVRIQDVLENKEVYGGITESDRKLIKHSIRDLMETGLSFDDAVFSMIEEFNQNINQLDKNIDEVAPMGTVGTIGAIGGAGPGTAATGTAATNKPQSNVTPTGTTQPVSSQSIDALAQLLGRAGLSPSQLSSVLSKARQQDQG